MMPLPRGYWYNPSLVDLEGTRLVAVYKHHLDRVPAEGKDATWFHYRLHERDPDSGRRNDMDRGQDWISDLKLSIERHNKVVIIEPLFDGGIIRNTGYIDNGSLSLAVELLPSFGETIKILPRHDGRDKGFCAMGYGDPNHIHNHPHVRR